MFQHHSPRRPLAAQQNNVSPIVLHPNDLQCHRLQRWLRQHKFQDKLSRQLLQREFMDKRSRPLAALL